MMATHQQCFYLINFEVLPLIIDRNITGILPICCHDADVAVIFDNIKMALY